MSNASMEALGHKDAGVRRAAADAMGEIRNPLSVEPLVTALGDADANVGAAAAAALGRNRRPPRREAIDRQHRVRRLHHGSGSD